MSWNEAVEERAEGTGAFLEAACDESGSDGENLTGGNTDVFAHASVGISVESAAAYVQEIRDRIRSPAEEYKANHLLREKHRAVLEWLLAPSGPIHGHAHVHLTEKAFFVVDRTVGLLLDEGHGESKGASDEAVALFRAGTRAFGSAGWREFLESANQLLRVRNDSAPGVPVEVFFRTVGALRDACPSGDSARVLERLAQSRSRAESYRAQILDGPPLVPLLNPLLPAIVRTAAYWTAGGQSVRLVHDRQNMLTPERIAWIEETARRDGIGLGGLRLVHSRLDPRVQLADFLAGIARRIASDELNGHGDPVLTALLRPYVGASSVWGDERSWARLGPAAADAVLPALSES